MKRVIFVGALALVGTVLLIKLFLVRPNEQTAGGGRRRELERGLKDVEARIRDLKSRAKKAVGEVERTLEVQLHVLEGRREDLAKAVAEIKSESKSFLARVRARREAA